MTCTSPSTYGSRSYCPGTISGVKSTAYGIGSQIVLQNVSVTARTASTVTVQALESTPCPAGYFCGATMTTVSLTVTWKKGQPAVHTVVNLFGTTTSGSMTPAGYTPGNGCYIDYC